LPSTTKKRIELVLLELKDVLTRQKRDNEINEKYRAYIRVGNLAASIDEILFINVDIYGTGDALRSELNFPLQVNCDPIFAQAS